MVNFDVINSFMSDKKFEFKTSLCEIMTKEGSDKGSGWHNYTTLYDHLFSKDRLIIQNIFELGLGTNNPNIPSTMGLNGTPLASHRGWKKYFENAKIFGADIDKAILTQEDRIQTFYCDQTNPNEIFRMWQNIPDEMDLIIDDGLHEFNANKTFYEGSIHKVSEGGTFIIEDISVYQIDTYKNFFENEKKSNKIKEFYLIEIPNNNNRIDNILAFIKR